MKKLYKVGFYRSLLSKSVVPLSEQFGEVALDTLITNETLKSIPILGQVVKLIQAGNDIRAYMFGKKVLNFLLELDSIPIEEKRKFIADLDNRESFGEKLGETLLFSLESANNADVAIYLGRAFGLLIKGEISEFTFENYQHVILSLNPFIVQQLHFGYQFNNVAGFSGNTMYYLANMGLIDMKIKPKNIAGEVEFEQMPSGNKFGQTFYCHILASE
ncbi:hypothetical protein ACXLPV_004825 [Vibrio parahaemolyticus]